MRCNLARSTAPRAGAGPSRRPARPATRGLRCEAALPPGDAPSGGGGATPSSRLTQPLTQPLPGYDTATSSAAPPPAPAAASPASQAPSGTAPTDSTIIRGSWEWWTAFFNAMDDAVRELDGVDEELAAAVAAEDYPKATALRVHQKRLEDTDSVAAVLNELRTAIAEERYGDAAALRDAGGAGLLGWWAGRGDDDPHGHLIHVTADFGRYVAHAYTGHNLAELAGLAEEHYTPGSGPPGGGGSGMGGSASAPASAAFTAAELAGGSIGSPDGPAEPEDSGAPVFEIFVRRDPDSGELLQRATALQAPASALAGAGVLEDLTDLLAAQVGQGAKVSVERGKDEEGVGFVRINVTGVTDDDEEGDGEGGGDAIADGATAQQQEEDDSEDEEINTIDDLMQMLQDQEELDRDAAAAAAGAFADDASTAAAAEAAAAAAAAAQGSDMVDAWVEIDGRLQRMRLEEVVAGAVGGSGGGSTSAADDSDSEDDEIVDISDIGDTLSEMGLGVLAQRVPATIEWAGRDAFTFVVSDELERKLAAAKAEADAAEAAAEAAQIEISSESDEEESGEAVDVEIVRGKAGEEGYRRGRTEIDDTSDESAAANAKKGSPAFSGRLDEIERIVRSAMGTAIAEGIGASGAGPAADGVLGLTGRVAYARLDLLADPPTDVFTGVYLGTFGPYGPEVIRVARTMRDGEEWVHGTKLTGDPNVPAGKVSFRARIGRQHRMSPAGVYAPEYGVQQRFKGQGRVAREGYAAAKWVDGELLTFSAANPVTRGAELGFVFNIDATRKYLLLFTKVRLNELGQMAQQAQGGGGALGPGAGS